MISIQRRDKNSSMKERRATIGDYDQICFLLDEVDKLHRDALPQIYRKPIGPVRSREYLEKELAKDDTTIFIAQEEDLLLGLVHLTVRSSDSFPLNVPRKFGYIHTLVVREDFQRLGIGQKLLEKACEWLKEKGVEGNVELNVWEFNKGAIKFYEKLGFDTIQRRMSKNL